MIQARWAIAWAALLAVGWTVEIVAALSASPGDTLSEHAWWLIGRVAYVDLAYSAAWAGILVTALVWSIRAHANDRKGDTLLEAVQWVFTRRGVGPALRFAWAAFFVWLAVHFTTGVWWVPEWVLGTFTLWLGVHVASAGKWA